MSTDCQACAPDPRARPLIRKAWRSVLMCQRPLFPNTNRELNVVCMALRGCHGLSYALLAKQKVSFDFQLVLSRGLVCQAIVASNSVCGQLVHPGFSCILHIIGRSSWRLSEPEVSGRLSTSLMHLGNNRRHISCFLQKGSDLKGCVTGTELGRQLWERAADVGFFMRYDK